MSSVYRVAIFALVVLLVGAGGPTLAQEKTKKGTIDDIDELLENPKNQVPIKTSKGLGCNGLRQAYKELRCDAAQNCDAECANLARSIRRCPQSEPQPRC